MAQDLCRVTLLATTSDPDTVRKTDVDDGI